MLTDAAVRKKKPDERKRVEIHDGRGLYLIIQPTGAKSWAYRYRVGGKSRKLTLGTFPAIDVAQARSLCSAAALKTKAGGDPALEHKSALEADDTFERIARLFIERYARPKNRGWQQSARWLGLKPGEGDTLVRNGNGAIAKWGSRKISTIKRADVIHLLDGLVDKGKPISANRTLAAVKKLFNWAEGRYGLIGNPCSRMEMPGTETARDRILSDDELVRVWKAAAERDIQSGSHFGSIIRLLILTGQRRSEVAGMKWSELDLPNKLWTIPRVRVKNDTEHTVPLSAEALAIIDRVPRVVSWNFAFTSTGKLPNNFSKAKVDIDKASGVKDWTIHDLRRTVASGMARLGVQLPVIEKVLNHTSGSFAGIVGVYQRHSFADEKRAALDLWGAHVARLVA
jgi:integrase